MGTEDGVCLYMEGNHQNIVFFTVHDPLGHRRITTQFTVFAGKLHFKELGTRKVHQMSILMSFFSCFLSLGLLVAVKHPWRALVLQSSVQVDFLLSGRPLTPF